MDNKIRRAVIKKAKQVKKELEEKNLEFSITYYRVFQSLKINFPSMDKKELHQILNALFQER